MFAHDHPTQEDVNSLDCEVPACVVTDRTSPEESHEGFLYHQCVRACVQGDPRYGTTGGDVIGQVRVEWEESALLDPVAVIVVHERGG